MRFKPSDITPEESTRIVVNCGFKYMLAEPFFYRFREDLGFLGEHTAEFWEVFQVGDEWWCVGYTGCGYDGPSGPLVFDWDYLMPGSFVHDVGHWCLGLGVLPESSNDALDRELAGIVRRGQAKIPWFLGGEPSRPARAWVVERGTNLVNGKLGDRPPQRVIPV